MDWTQGRNHEHVRLDDRDPDGRPDRPADRLGADGDDDAAVTDQLDSYVLLIRHGRPRRRDYEVVRVLARDSAAARRTVGTYLDKRDAVISVYREEEA